MDLKKQDPFLYFLQETHFISKDKHRLSKRKGRKKTFKNKSKTINKMAIRIFILIITLNINGLNAPTKRHTQGEWIQKQDPYTCYLKETHFRSRDTYRLKVRGWKRYSMHMEIKRKLE